RRLLAPEIDVHDALALGDVELVDVPQHAERGIALDGGLLRIALGGDRDLVPGKEPLRLGAGHSAVAVVAPVDLAHGVPPVGWRSAKSDRATQVLPQTLQVIG